MDRIDVRNKLIQVLTSIQEASGLNCPEIKGSTKPVEDLEKFDSKVWPVAIGMLSKELRSEIPTDLNLFRKKGTAVPLSIDEIVRVVEEEVTKAAAGTA